MQRILLYLGKFPGYGADLDGGSILALQLINTLKKVCVLDVVFIRKRGEIFNDPEVNAINYVEYVDPNNNKFFRRLANLETNRMALENYATYDKIIVAHVSKLFGLQSYPADFWEKVILFPMFCSKSYMMAGENVPQEYIYQEQEVLSLVSKIITPSISERKSLIYDYHCNKDCIYVIPRSIDGVFNNQCKYPKDGIFRIVYIASIKPQKNVIESIELLRLLLDKRERYELHIVGSIQDENIYKIMIATINKYHMQKSVFFHSCMNQYNLALLLSKMNINISVSKWETFGRGIYEGFLSGLPTFILNRLEDVYCICKNLHGVYSFENIYDMAIGIEKCCNQYEECLPDEKTLAKLRIDLSNIVEQQRILSIVNE